MVVPSFPKYKPGGSPPSHHIIPRAGHKRRNQSHISSPDENTMATYKCYGPRADDRASDKGRSQRHASTGQEDSEEGAQRASRGSPQPSQCWFRPHHKFLCRGKQWVPRIPRSSSSKSSTSQGGSGNPEPRDDHTTPERGRGEEARGKLHAHRHSIGPGARGRGRSDLIDGARTRSQKKTVEALERSVAPRGQRR